MPRLGPRRRLQELIFFLKGRLTARYMWQRQVLAQLNSYFMVDCK